MLMRSARKVSVFVSVFALWIGLFAGLPGAARAQASEDAKKPKQEKKGKAAPQKKPATQVASAGSTCSTNRAVSIPARISPTVVIGSGVVSVNSERSNVPSTAGTFQRRVLPPTMPEMT